MKWEVSAKKKIGLPLIKQIFQKFMSPIWKQIESNFIFDKSLLMADYRTQGLFWCPVLSYTGVRINTSCVIRFEMPKWPL